MGSPATAFAAAGYVASWSRQEQALSFIASRGLYGATCDEVALGCGWKERYSSRPRISELHKMGFIAVSGKCRRGVSGLWQTVWVIVKFAPSGPEQGDLLDLLEAIAGWR